MIVLDVQKKTLDTVWFRNLRSSDGAIRHRGDNLTGDGNGDDEVIHVDLDRLDTSATHLVFTVNSFRGQTFNEVDNAFARLVDATSNSELCRYTLAKKGKHTGVIMAVVSKTGSDWQMKASGLPGRGATVNDMAAAAAALV